MMGMWKKGRKVWLVKMNEQAVFHAVVGMVAMDQADDTCVMVRYEFERDGVKDSVVTDCRPKDVFRTKRDALLAAANECGRSAAKYAEQKDKLIAQALAERK